MINRETSLPVIDMGLGKFTRPKIDEKFDIKSFQPKYDEDDVSVKSSIITEEESDISESEDFVANLVKELPRDEYLLDLRMWLLRWQNKDEDK